MTVLLVLECCLYVFYFSTILPLLTDKIFVLRIDPHSRCYGSPTLRAVLTMPGNNRLLMVIRPPSQTREMLVGPSHCTIQPSSTPNHLSSVDPLSPHGPLPFNSLALLRIAYIRFNVDNGTMQSLRSWDPSLIATSIKKSLPVRRGKRMTRAALHCVHALNIPVISGINFVARTQVFLLKCGRFPAFSRPLPCEPHS